MHRIFSAATLLQLKSGAKVDIKKAPLKRGAETPHIPQLFREISANTPRRPQKFRVTYSSLRGRNRRVKD